MWDFIKLSSVERNGTAWVYLALMTSARDEQFVLSPESPHGTACPESQGRRSQTSENDDQRHPSCSRVWDGQGNIEGCLGAWMHPLCCHLPQMHIPGCCEELGAEEVDETLLAGVQRVMC